MLLVGSSCHGPLGEMSPLPTTTVVSAAAAGDADTTPRPRPAASGRQETTKPSVRHVPRPFPPIRTHNTRQRRGQVCPLPGDACELARSMRQNKDLRPSAAAEVFRVRRRLHLSDRKMSLRRYRARRMIAVRALEAVDASRGDVVARPRARWTATSPPRRTARRPRTGRARSVGCKRPRRRRHVRSGRSSCRARGHRGVERPPASWRRESADRRCRSVPRDQKVAASSGSSRPTTTSTPCVSTSGAGSGSPKCTRVLSTWRANANHPSPRQATTASRCETSWCSPWTWSTDGRNDLGPEQLERVFRAAACPSSSRAR